MKKLVSLIVCITMILTMVSQCVFAAGNVSKFNISVTAPKEADKPVESGSVPETASSFVEKVEWSGELDENGCFKSGVAYTVNVYVKLKEGQDKQITVVKGKATVNGNEAELYYVSDDKQQGIVRYTFAPVVSVRPKKIALDESGKSIFEDVSPDMYYASAVNWAVAEGITAGTSDTTFSPDLTCTKAQILTLLWRAVGAPEYEGPNQFTNVSESDYYYQAAQWACSKTLISGRTFNANEPCTRGNVVFYLWKLAGCPKDLYDGRFTDVKYGTNVGHYVGWAVSEGITSGTTETTFSPDQTCTRGQIVTFLCRAFREGTVK